MSDRTPDPLDLEPIRQRIKAIALFEAADLNDFFDDWAPGWAAFMVEMPSDVLALIAEVDRLRVRPSGVRTEPDVAPCGHYRRFTLPYVDYEGTETLTCMQCDRDATHDALATSEARVTRLRELAKAWTDESQRKLDPSNPRVSDQASIRANRAYNNALVKCIDELLALLDDSLEPQVQDTKDDRARVATTAQAATDRATAESGPGVPSAPAPEQP